MTGQARLPLVVEAIPAFKIELAHVHNRNSFVPFIKISPLINMI